MPTLTRRFFVATPLESRMTSDAFNAQLSESLNQIKLKRETWQKSKNRFSSQAL